MVEHVERRSCPICQAAMGQADHDSVVIDICRAHGVWLDRGEFEFLRGRAEGRARRGRHKERDRSSVAESLSRIIRMRRPSTSVLVTSDLVLPEDGLENAEIVPECARRCPRCRAFMESIERPDYLGSSETIIIDVCEEHGIWYDQAELEILLRRAARNARTARRLALVRHRRARIVAIADRQTWFL